MSTSAPTPDKPHSAPDDTPRFRYDARLAGRIEEKWQKAWDERGTFVQPGPGQPGFDATRPKFFVMDMFPYPSGAGLHVGHPEGYTATDIVARFMRMKGRNVLHPMGWDAFGLPAEQYAIQTGVHPAITTKNAIDTFRRQLKRFGFSYDWSREVSTIDPAYYRWTQWIWLRAYSSWYDAERNRARPLAELIGELESGDLRVGPDGEPVHIDPNKAAMGPLGTEPVGTRRWHQLSPEEQRAFIDSQRLAYLDEVTVNWCPKLGTALANEEVIDGKSERGGFPVYRKPLKQWVFRITAYAERLLRDLENLDWPESTKTQQAEWIGRSEGAEIDFPLENPPSTSFGPTLTVYTTRPDTIFGATYMVIAPEHPLVDAVLAQPSPDFDPSALGEYARAARNRADVDRMADAKEKTGVFTGLYAINPATGGRIPIWTADYVLMGYGHGAIMAVPAHDQRDFDFARAFDLPIIDVVYPRAVLGMKFYVESATAEEIDSGAWFPLLADFLGVITSANTPPGGFDDALRTARSRRSTADACAMDERARVENLAGVVGARRGATQLTWLDALEELGFTSWEALSERMKSGTFYAAGREGVAHDAPGFAVNSSSRELSIDGLPTEEARKAVTAWLERTARGGKRINYRLRDWLFSRQRYWGEPFPVVYDEKGHHHPIADKALPVRLPDLADYTPEESDDPRPLLAKASAWVHTTAGEAGVDPDVLPPGTKVRRETNTMPGWAGSCWYYLRYCDPSNAERFVSREAERYWLGDRGVDLYIGGNEHAVLHLLYARFWHKILFDLGEVGTPEPFTRLFHQGMITSHAYQRPDKSLVPIDQVDEPSEGTYVERASGLRVSQVVAKMSKSLKNVINPDDIIEDYGADTFRLYEMYMGPLDASKPWATKDLIGLFRFLQRAWRLVVDESTGALRLVDSPSPAVEKQLNRTILKVEEDIPRLAMNTAIASLIEFVNVATAEGGGGARPSLTRSQAERFALALAPFAPHIAEEFWELLGNTGSLAYAPWPAADKSAAGLDTVEVPVQIAGKIRAKIMVPAGHDAATLEAAARADDKVKAAIEGKTIVKVIAVPGKMVNVVVK